MLARLPPVPESRNPEQQEGGKEKQTAVAAEGNSPQGFQAWDADADDANRMLLLVI